MPQPHLDNFNFADFWKDTDYALKNYVEAPPSNELIKSIEAELGYKLPASYVYLMQLHNGGTPRFTACPSTEPTSWAEEHVAITGIFGIGRHKPYSLGGEFGSRFTIEHWLYRNIGVCICDCPSAGHDMIMLDYTQCGRTGEPEVVHVDQECNYIITFLAPDFETFIRKLVPLEKYD